MQEYSKHIARCFDCFWRYLQDKYLFLSRKLAEKYAKILKKVFQEEGSSFKNWEIFWMNNKTI